MDLVKVLIEAQVSDSSSVHKYIFLKDLIQMLSVSPFQVNISALEWVGREMVSFLYSRLHFDKRKIQTRKIT